MFFDTVSGSGFCGMIFHTTDEERQKKTRAGELMEKIGSHSAHIEKSSILCFYFRFFVYFCLVLGGCGDEIIHSPHITFGLV